MYAKHLGLSAKLTICIIPIYVVEEKKRTHVKILPASNMLITFKRLFSCGFRHFLNHTNM